MPLKNVTITMPEDYAKLLQRIANEEQDGNKSAVIRELLLLRFDQLGIVPCSACGKLCEIGSICEHCSLAVL